MKSQDMTLHVSLRVSLKRVASNTDDRLVRRAIVYRLHPAGLHYLEIGRDEDPQSAHERDVRATQLAERAGLWTETGRAEWTREGPVWIESFAEGEKWTPIPRQP
jgi:hypothetical protein